MASAVFQESLINERIPNLQNLGWRRDIADLILAMDLDVVQNRATYLDFLPIECLMLGPPLAVPAVGGNTWLLNESRDSSVQEITFNDANQVNNFESLVEAAPPRVDFDNSHLAACFNDTAFVKSHEDLAEAVRKAIAEYH